MIQKNRQKAKIILVVYLAATLALLLLAWLETGDVRLLASGVLASAAAAVNIGAVLTFEHLVAPNLWLGYLLGAAQLIPDVEDPGWIITAEYYSDWFSVPAGTAYYDAPEGSVLGTVEFDYDFTLLAVYGDWCHVCFGESMESVWVRTADGTIDETMH